MNRFGKITSIGFGARFYDPRFSFWYGVDPLAEKFPGFSPYNYCLNNPIMLVDPDGRDVLPFNVKMTLSATGAGKLEYGISSKVFIDAMKDFMKTTYDKNFVT